MKIHITQSEMSYWVSIWVFTINLQWCMTHALFRPLCDRYLAFLSDTKTKYEHSSSVLRQMLTKFKSNGFHWWFYELVSILIKWKELHKYIHNTDKFKLWFLPRTYLCTWVFECRRNKVTKSGSDWPTRLPNSSSDCDVLVSTPGWLSASEADAFTESTIVTAMNCLALLIFVLLITANMNLT